MRRQQKVATVLLSAVLLMPFSGVSLFADMQSASTKEGGTLPPVAVFDATTSDVIGTAPMATACRLNGCFCSGEAVQRKTLSSCHLHSAFGADARSA